MQTGCKHTANMMETFESEPDRHCQCHPGLPRPLAVGRGFERLWRPVRCQIHCPLSVVSGRPRREPSQRHGGQSGASCVQLCGRPDPPSAKRCCAGVTLFGRQTPCCILGISDATCSSSAAAEPPTRRRSPACQCQATGSEWPIEWPAWPGHGQ